MKKEQFHKYDNEAKKYGVAISEVADWNYGCEARTFYKIKPQSFHCEVLQNKIG